MKGKALVLILLSCFISHKLLATGQIADLLIVEKDTFPIFSNPLEPYLEQKGVRYFPELEGCGSTACWRGYRAIWTIERDSLYLLAIQSCHKGPFCQNTKDANLKIMFGPKCKNDRVFASWFSGTIRQPLGELVWYVHMGYGSIFESDNFYEITNGNIEKEYKIDNLVPDSTRLPISDRDTVCELLFGMIERRFDWKNIQLTEYDTITSLDIDFIFSRNGKFKRARNSFDYFQREPEDNFFKRIQLKYWTYTDPDYWLGRRVTRRINKVVKDIPKVEKLKIDGKPTHLTVRLWLKFDFKAQKIEWLNDYS